MLAHKRDPSAASTQRANTHNRTYRYRLQRETIKRVATIISLATQTTPAPLLPSPGKRCCLVSTATKAQHSSKRNAGAAANVRLVLLVYDVVVRDFLFYSDAVWFLQITTQPSANLNPDRENHTITTNHRLPQSNTSAASPRFFCSG